MSENVSVAKAPRNWIIVSRLLRDDTFAQLAFLSPINVSYRVLQQFCCGQLRLQNCKFAIICLSASFFFVYHVPFTGNRFPCGRLLWQHILYLVATKFPKRKCSHQFFPSRFGPGCLSRSRRSAQKHCIWLSVFFPIFNLVKWKQIQR